jgi:UDP-galactopyranose mutase
MKGIPGQACCYAPDHSEHFESVCDEIPDYVDLFCFSHIRWDLVFQRPQHLMSRFAKKRRVFFVEEPVLEPGSNCLSITRREDGVNLITPHLDPDTDKNKAQRKFLSDFFALHKIQNSIFWYVSPMFLKSTRHLNPDLVVYDCMDELSGFAGAPVGIQQAEAELFSIADLVFTGGLALYEAKSRLHENIHAFPSSIDFDHFSKARTLHRDPIDQSNIAKPRIGYFGVIDERMDQILVSTAAELRPDWQWIFIGPVLKVDPEKLPRHPNIHYFGKKDYKSLPSYLAGWDVAILPFARNDATRFISPTKTPEYLAAGKPVVSTSIRDVVRPYGELGLVKIADDPEKFVAAIEKSMALGTNWLNKVDSYLWNISWDQTWNRMDHLLAETLNKLSGISASPKLTLQGVSNAHV